MLSAGKLACTVLAHSVDYWFSRNTEATPMGFPVYFFQSLNRCENRTASLADICTFNTPGLLTNLQAIDKSIFQVTRTGKNILSLKGLQGSSLMHSVLWRGGINGHLQYVHIGGICSQSWNFPFFICSVNVVLIAANKIQQEKTQNKTSLLMFIFIPFNLWSKT